MVYAPRVVKSENTKCFFYSFTTAADVPCEYFVIIMGYFSFLVFSNSLCVDVRRFIVPRISRVISNCTYIIIIMFITTAIGTGWNNVTMLLFQRSKQCLQIGSFSRWHHIVIWYLSYFRALRRTSREVFELSQQHIVCNVVLYLVLP